MILDFVSLSSQEPMFDGCEVEILRYNEDSSHAVVKAKVWKKDCTRPIESIADSRCIERSQKSDPLQQTILFAKARAMNEAFFVPFHTEEMEPEAYRTYACYEESCSCHEDPFSEYHNINRVMASDSTGEWPQVPQTAEYASLSSPSYESLEQHHCHTSSFQYEGFVGVPFPRQTSCSNSSEDCLSDADTLDQPSYLPNPSTEHPLFCATCSNQATTPNQEPYVLHELRSSSELSSDAITSCSFTKPLYEEKEGKEPHPSVEHTLSPKHKKKPGSS